MRPGLTIHEFSDDLAVHFRDINAEWIGAMFALEPTDRDVLEHPRARIVDAGGDILFVEADGLGIVGACALQKTGPTAFELTKMGVRESARGLKAGEFTLLIYMQYLRERAADAKSTVEAAFRRSYRRIGPAVFASGGVSTSSMSR